MIKIKICGIRTEKEIEAVNKAKADYVGFVFAPSKRRVTAKEAANLLKLLDKDITPVGVFKDASVNEIIETLKVCPLKIIQLHGSENEDYIYKLKNKFPKIEIWKAGTAEESESFSSAADKILFDGKEAGSGKGYDYSVISHIKKDYILAGGLTPENVKEALRKTSAFAVDISSGAEGKDDFKDIDLIKKFIANVKEAEKMKKGRYGEFGGQYIPETLMPALIELEKAYNEAKNDKAFTDEFERLLKEYAGRPSMLYYANNLTKKLGGAKIYLKREDLNHTGSHKINNCLGQALLAKKMGKTRLIAETGAGQHGVATATAAAFFGMDCVIFMGREDTQRQALNVFRMELLGAKVCTVDSGTKTLKDAVNEAFREWTSRIDDTFYVLGSVMGPHPYPQIVRDFQSVIGKEVKKQILEKEKRLPDYILACIGGGSNAMGIFYDFIEDKEVKLIGVEAAGEGIETTRHAAAIAKGEIGIFHGMKSYFVQDEDGQIAPVHSISAGLDYPGIGPEHAHLYKTGRAEYVSATDKEAVDAFEILSKTEGIIPAVESAHAVAYALKLAPTLSKDKIIVINLSGRGDKDVKHIAAYMGRDINE